MSRVLLSLLSAFVGISFAGQTACADAHNLVLAEDVDFRTPCVGKIIVTVDPSLDNGVSVDTEAENAPRVRLRVVKEQGGSRVNISSAICSRQALLPVVIAPNVGISIHESSGTLFILRGRVASLEASLDEGELDADAVQSLDISLKGTEQVYIGNLNRAGQIVARGSSSLVANQAALDALSAQLSDTSRLIIRNAKIETLTLSTSGGAAATILGAVTNATIKSGGTGLVSIPPVSGVLNKTGPVEVQTPKLPPIAPSKAAASNRSNPATSEESHAGIKTMAPALQVANPPNAKETQDGLQTPSNTIISKPSGGNAIGNPAMPREEGSQNAPNAITDVSREQTSATIPTITKSSQDTPSNAPSGLVSKPALVQSNAKS